QSLLDRLELRRVGDDLNRLALDARIAGAQINRLQPDLIRVAAVGVDHDLPLPREHPGHAPRGAQVATGPAEEVANFTAGGVASVGQGVDDDSYAMRAVALEPKLLERGAAQLASAPLDGTLDVLLRHVDVAGFLHRQTEPVVTVRVASAFPGGEDDFPGRLGELLPFLGVGEGLLVLDRRPLGMSRHLLPVGKFSPASDARLDAVRVAGPCRRPARFCPPRSPPAGR